MGVKKLRASRAFIPTPHPYLPPQGGKEFLWCLRDVAYFCIRAVAGILFILVLVTGAHAADFTAQVIVVMDGDTVMVLHDKRKITVRLAGIDAPEKLQAFGAEAQKSLAEMVLRKEVRVTPTAVDDYGRVVGVLRADGMNVNEEQLRRGMAWEYSQYHSDKSLIALQSDAQRAQRGLWAGANPVAPWEFRKTHAPTREVLAQTNVCGGKHYCSQMVSCDEAKFYLNHCKVKSLDRNEDDVPCEKLCVPANK
jgi:endonuclease YncB( thermonuclease family)